VLISPLLGRISPLVKAVTVLVAQKSTITIIYYAGLHIPLLTVEVKIAQILAAASAFLGCQNSAAFGQAHPINSTSQLQAPQPRSV
jgi:hypothetical protein